MAAAPHQRRASEPVPHANRFRRRRLFLAGGLAACGVAAMAAVLPRVRGSDGRGQLRFTGDAMGTTYTVTFVAPTRAMSFARAARDAVDAAVASVDAQMSTFARDSEISRLNRRAPGRPMALSQETLAVLDTARRVSEATGGAFDVTAGPLVNAWGFGPSGAPRIPAPAELAMLRQRVGFRALDIDSTGRSATKMHPDMYVDLSGIAKGYGADRAARALEALGIVDYAIELGGEVMARGRNVDGDRWRVAIEEPQASPRKVRRIVAPGDRAMATSGDYRIYFERGGRRYCHEIDPVSASPVSHALASVTVVADDCATADALATGLMVLGPKDGYALAQRAGLAAYFVERVEQGGLVDRNSTAFDALADV